MKTLGRSGFQHQNGSAAMASLRRRSGSNDEEMGFRFLSTGEEGDIKTPDGSGSNIEMIQRPWLHRERGPTMMMKKWDFNFLLGRRN
ncbi:hypothetical protein SLA2020_471830 [Shorea laevis]